MKTVNQILGGQGKISKAQAKELIQRVKDVSEMYMDQSDQVIDACDEAMELVTAMQLQDEDFTITHLIAFLMNQAVEVTKETA